MTVEETLDLDPHRPVVCQEKAFILLHLARGGPGQQNQDQGESGEKTISARVALPPCSWIGGYRG
jgi:hypothetical protein